MRMPKAGLCVLAVLTGGGLSGCLEEGAGDGGGTDGQASDARAADGGGDGGRIDAGPQPACPEGAARDACGVCAGPGPQSFWADQDADGRGDPRIEVQACARPVGFAANADDAEPDCATNDTDACGVCAGTGERSFYFDADGDGRGDSAVSVVACRAPLDFVAVGGDPEPDCATDDSDVCGVCGGPGELRFYLDADGDGRGDPAVPADACEAPEGFVANADDPDPTCATDDADVCGVCGGPGARWYFADADGDGLGDPAVSVQTCVAPEGHVDNDEDLQPGCATNDIDVCGVCGGANAGRDCHGTCDGQAFVDGCGRCVGGDTGVTPDDDDTDGDGIPDACDDCIGGAPPSFIVEWDAVPPFVGNGQQGAAGGPYTFQVILNADGSFRYQYRSMEPFAASATVGWQFATDGGVTLSFNNDFVLDQPVVTFTPQPDGRYETDYVQPMAWFDTSTLGTPLVLGDDSDEEVPIGFNFPFAQATYDRVRVSANGLLVFSGQMPGYQNGVMPVANAEHLMAPFWDDLNPSREGQVRYFTAVPACAEDCNGDLGGYAVLDECGVCVGGNTGRRPSENVDCNGECDGAAYLDDCRQCVGGSTGREPSQDCRPDLIVDGRYLAETLELDTIDAQDPCLLAERCVRGLGQRKILRFGTRIANIGQADLILGEPRDGVDFWTWDQCHQHFHFDAYAAYDLFDVAAGEVLPIGAKSGFSVIDIAVWDPELAPNGCVGYNGRNQGITAGCQDTYSRSLTCQWIDITDVADGVYEVVVTTNPDAVIAETDLSNNSARVRVRLEGDTVTLIEE